MFNEVCAEELTPKDKPQTEFELFHINTILLISRQSIFSTCDNQVIILANSFSLKLENTVSTVFIFWKHPVTYIFVEILLLLNCL